MASGAGYIWNEPAETMERGALQALQGERLRAIAGYVYERSPFYGAFGEVRSSSGSQSLFGYTGEQTETTTGNTFLRARSYNPDTGRFLSADSVQPNAPGTQGYNRYAYTANNPTTWTDPSGHSVNDALTWMGELQTLVTTFVDFAVAVTPLLLAVLGTGFIGSAVGLVVGMYFLAFALLMLSIIGTMLLLMVDPFDFYSGANSTTTQTKQRDELTQSPEAICTISNSAGTPSSESLIQAVKGMSLSDPLAGAIVVCIGDREETITFSDIVNFILINAEFRLCIFKCVLELLKLPIDSAKVAPKFKIGSIGIPELMVGVYAVATIVAVGMCLSGNGNICVALALALSGMCLVCASASFFCRDYLSDRRIIPRP